MLHVRDAGAGQAVLLLHAFPLNSRMWEPQVEPLRERGRWIAPDFPGFGLSPVAGATPSLEDYARQALSVLDRLAVDRVVVVGLSMGGYVAFRLVETLGDRLRGLVLADTRATADTAEAVAARHELAAEVEVGGAEVAAAEFLPKLLGRTTVRSRPKLIDRVHAIILENTPAGIAGALRAMAARSDATKLLKTIVCPVLCVVGAEDTLTSAETVRAMAGDLADAHVEVVPDAGHLVNLENPGHFNQLLTGFLNRIGV